MLGHVHIDFKIAKHLLKLYSFRIGLTLTTLLPFLVLFDAYRTIELQGLLVIIIGACAAAYCVTSLLTNRTNILYLMLLYGLSILISLIITPNTAYNFFGAPYIRLGAAGLIACMLIGIAGQSLGKKLLPILYVWISVMAYASVLYSALTFNTLVRIGGIFSQADIFACIIGCGILFGFAVYQNGRCLKSLLINQVILVGLLLLSGTRAVIFAVTILSLIWFLQNKVSYKKIGISAILFVCIIALANLLVPRLLHVSYAAESISYRYELQRISLNAASDKPFFGYGPGNLADALNCSRIADSALQKTCDEGYFFNSSHNIFLDRIIAVGWVGGLSLFSLVLLGLSKSLRHDSRIFAYVLALIVVYYLTNVTSIILEILFWIVLMRCLLSRASTSP